MPVHLNEDYDWESFDPRDYFAHNYASMRTDDAEMLALVRDHFAELAKTGRPLDGIDVGSGANLYPALALLPYCDEINLYEYSNENVEWLQASVRDLPDTWQPFWRLLAGEPAEPYARVRERVRKSCRVSQGSIFDLERGRWEIGTMFFVAESLTEDPEQFDQALRCFFGALRPGAPFAAAFMEGSVGYDVGDVHFPAISISKEQLEERIAELGLVGDYEVRHVEINPAPLRAGYTGYLVAIGKIKG